MFDSRNAPKEEDCLYSRTVHTEKVACPLFLCDMHNQRVQIKPDFLKGITFLFRLGVK